jgi:hypothetical protein
MEDLTPTSMSRDEALAWKARFGKAAQEFRLLLWEGHARYAWHALGYRSWTACVQAIAEEYGLSERHLWRLNSANVTESVLTPANMAKTSWVFATKTDEDP